MTEDPHDAPASRTSPCHRALLFAEEVYLLVPRPAPYAGHGKKVIGSVNCCGKCRRPIGEFTRAADCPEDFNGTHWHLAIDRKREPPWNFYRGMAEGVYGLEGRAPLGSRP